MANPQTESEARRRILSTARDLFCRNGYRATGINEIIRKSGVAKATFYAHFPSKESLAYAYVESMNREETRVLVESLEKFPGPYEKLIGLIEFLIPWSRERDYRGCAYLNISSEITDHANPVRRESKDHYLAVRRFVVRLMQELKKAQGGGLEEPRHGTGGRRLHADIFGSIGHGAGLPQSGADSRRDQGRQAPAALIFFAKKGDRPVCPFGNRQFERIPRRRGRR
jgi:AcrR family transcriptional regulator